MSESQKKIEALIEEAEGHPFGPQERALLAEAVRLAQESGDVELEYLARIRIIPSAEMTGDTDAVLSNFAWCVAKNEEDPSRFPTHRDDDDLLWYYKWIPATLSSHTTFSREDILAGLANMEERYRREGVGTHGVLQARFSEARRSGRMAEAEELRGLLATTPRDEYSHCDACVRAEQVDYFLEAGRDEEALAAFDEIMDQNLTCGEEPESVMGSVMLALLRAGRTEDAEKAHRLGYRLARSNEALTVVHMQHVEFCALTGNHARALTLLERHLGGLVHDDLDQNGRFGALLCVGVAMESVALAGHGELVVRGSDDTDLVRVLGQHAGEYTVAQLAEAAWAAAAPIGAAFDARNGSDRYARLLSEARATVLESYPLSLGESETLRIEPAAAPATDDVDGWIERAHWAGVSDDAAGLAAAVHSGLAAHPTPRQKLSLWGLLATMYSGEERDEAIAARVEVYTSLGMDEEAAFEAEHGATMAGLLDEDSAQSLRDLLAAGQSPEITGRIRSELGIYLLARGETDAAMRDFLEGAEASDTADDAESFRRNVIGAAWAVPIDEENGELQGRLLSMAEEAGPVANQQYDVLYLRAVEAMGVLGEPERALSMAKAAADLAASQRALSPLGQVTRFRADLLSQLERHSEAASALHLYSGALADAGLPANVGVMVSEGKALLRAGEPQAALEVLTEAASAFEGSEEDSDVLAVAIDRWFGEAAAGCDFYGTAYESWSRALERGEAAYHAAPADEGASSAGVDACLSARHLTELAARADEREDASNFGKRAVALATELGEHEPGLIPTTLQSVGRSLCQVGDDAGLALLEAAEERGRAEGAGWFAADVLDARGRALIDLGRPDEALPLLLRAADEYAAEGDGNNAALGEYAVGRVLSELGREEEATAVLGNALERVQHEPGDIRSGVAAALGDLLESQGRADEAAEVRKLLG